MVIAVCARQSATGGFNWRSDWTSSCGDINFYVHSCDNDDSWMFLVVTRWPVQMPANPSNTIVVEDMSGGSPERDGRPWFVVICLTCRVGTILLKTAEDASSSSENGLLWSNFHCGEPQTPDFGFVVVGTTDSPAPLHC